MVVKIASPSEDIASQLPRLVFFVFHSYYPHVVATVQAGSLLLCVNIERPKTKISSSHSVYFYLEMHSGGDLISKIYWSEISILCLLS